MIVHEVHGEQVKRLPPDSEVLAASKKTNIEMWALGSQVLGIQSHPEMNSFYIQDMIVTKLFDLGRLDDTQKKEALFALTDPSKPLSRNIMLKILYSFLKEGDL
jgi:hypothetical protein